MDTTRFIVDTYHYNNHRAQDEICRKWCNPAPNLVGEKIDEDGNLIQWREFNTQVCEQLNAWLAGYESILKQMTSKNFNWFIHTMLVYHVKHVLAKMKSMKDDDSTDEESSDDESSDDESSDDESSDGESSNEERNDERSNDEESSNEESSEEESNKEKESDSKSKSSSDNDDDESDSTSSSDHDMHVSD